MVQSLLRFIGKYKLTYPLLMLVVCFTGIFVFADRGVKSEIVTNLLLCSIYALALSIAAYVINHLLIPRLLYQKKSLLFIIASLLLIVLMGFIMMPAIHYISGTNFLIGIGQNLPASWVFSYFIPLSLLLVVTSIVKINRDNNYSKSKLASLEKEKAETELSFLKSQMNPHFLLNSLNTIYFQIDKSNTTARETVVQFSDLLRYQLYECNADLVDIDKEINYLKSYVALQQIRKGNACQAQFENNFVSGFKIAPLLLITFIENAFKYLGKNSDGSCFVYIKMNTENGVFNFNCSNSVDSFQQKEAVDYGGLGIQNTQRRLHIIYPEKHSLQISKEKNIFSVSLKINIE
jgi:two-component system, LytTR family, sensor kinase